MHGAEIRRKEAPCCITVTLPAARMELQGGGADDDTDDERGKVKVIANMKPVTSVWDYWNHPLESWGVRIHLGTFRVHPPPI